MQLTHFQTAMLAALVALATLSPATAQSDVETGLDVFPSFSLGNAAKSKKEPAKFSAVYSRTDTATGQLSVSATISSGWHIYSITQAAGGPTPTTLKLVEKSGAKLIDQFIADQPPLQSVSKVWPGLDIEEHEGKVVWSAKIALPAELNGPLEVALNALVCSSTDGSCVPFNETLVATLNESESTAVAVPAQTTTEVAPSKFRDEGSVVEWSGRIEPAVVAPGQKARLFFTAKPDETYHVYAAAVDDSESSTNFVVSEKSGLLLGAPVPSAAPITETPFPGLPTVSFHESEITWSIPVVIGEDVAPGEKKIAGAIGYQACTDRSCLPPKALKFIASFKVAESGSVNPAAANVSFMTAPFAETLDAAAETDWVDKAANAVTPTPVPARLPASKLPKVDEPKQQNSSTNDQPAELIVTTLPLPAIIAMAICGGLILNLMPCVLPVVGLKVLSFAEQAGEKRSRVLMLNIWYTLGILVVFWALAVIAVLFSFSWGEQFTYFNFRYGVTLLVFAMALSFLGVWEIPIPGFVGGKSTQQLQRREGAVGAFFKGIFTTMLATPCSGPLLGTVFAFTIGKSALVTSVIFTAVGFGMALPYLLIALYPGLLVYFPKPGAWMDTFKQLLAFLLLGTVVYLFGGFADDDRMPVFASLIGVWFGCWLIGQVPGWANLDRRIAAWAGGAASAALICILAFRYLAPSPPVLAWEPYDEARLQQLQREGRTVLIDFTAKWCVNCIVNYNVAINTPKTSKLVDELDAVPMLADWTDHNAEIKNKLLELNSNSIPVLAIYPGSNPESPIILRDLISQGDVLTALRKAGSMKVEQLSSTVPPLGTISMKNH